MFVVYLICPILAKFVYILQVYYTWTGVIMIIWLSRYLSSSLEGLVEKIWELIK